MSTVMATKQKKTKNTQKDKKCFKTAKNSANKTCFNITN